MFATAATASPDAPSLLDAVYDFAADGLPTLDSAYELAADYASMPGTLRERIDRLIAFQDAKAAASGFVTGLGGAATLAVAIPAGFAATTFVQVRTVMAIAHLAGFDLQHDMVRTLCYACLCGAAAKDLARDVAIGAATRSALARQVALHLPARLGTRGAADLTRLVPLVGGLVGAAFDGLSTHAVGVAAREVFLPYASAS